MRWTVEDALTAAGAGGRIHHRDAARTQGDGRVGLGADVHADLAGLTPMVQAQVGDGLGDGQADL